MLVELKNEIDRLLLIADASQKAELTALSNQIQPKVDNIVATRDELAAIESAITSASTDAEIIAQTQIAYPTLLQGNEKTKDATAFIISTGPIIDITPGFIAEPPPEEEPPPDDDSDE